MIPPLLISHCPTYEVPKNHNESSSSFFLVCNYLRTAVICMYSTIIAEKNRINQKYLFIYGSSYWSLYCAIFLRSVRRQNLDRPTRLSEIKGLCLVKCSRESLQFFSYLWNENTLYFVFILCYFIFPLILSNCPGLCWQLYMMCLCNTLIWQNLMCFIGTFHQGKTSYIWRVWAWNIFFVNLKIPKGKKQFYL